MCAVCGCCLRMVGQVDGASDNIAYTTLYFAAWLLRMSEQKCFGDLLALESIVISRLPVGHTHIDIDQAFSVLARHFWGRKNRRHAAPDVFTLKAFLEEMKAAHKNMIKKGELSSLGCCYDFNTHFADIKHKKTDEGIKKWHVFELSRKESDPGKVFMRTKKHMDSTKWVEYREGKPDAGVYWPNRYCACVPRYTQGARSCPGISSSTASPADSYR